MSKSSLRILQLNFTSKETYKRSKLCTNASQGKPENWPLYTGDIYIEDDYFVLTDHCSFHKH